LESGETVEGPYIGDFSQFTTVTDDIYLQISTDIITVPNVSLLPSSLHTSVVISLIKYLHTKSHSLFRFISLLMQLHGLGHPHSKPVLEILCDFYSYIFTIVRG